MTYLINASVVPRDVYPSIFLPARTQTLVSRKRCTASIRIFRGKSGLDFGTVAC
jgi:hypothetical protein